jgi:beta-lactamase class A
MITKRQVAFGMAASAVGIAIRPVHGGEAALFDRLKGELARVEAESRGRLGVAMLDTRSNAHCDHRGDERFPMCSTFKLLAAAAVLARVDAGKEQLQRRIRFAPSDIVVNSPITQNRTGDDGMSLDELCEAAMIVSDNTAGNLLLDALGGPAGLTAFARSLGYSVTRLDRIEPDLNEALPDDPRDTTSPVAMLANLRGLVLGDVLSVQSRTRLTGWLVGNKTGDTRLRAGLPKGWRVGDKTGAGDHGTTNDVGVIWPGERQPVLVATYLTGTSGQPGRA